MIRVSTEELEPGMVLATPVPHPQCSEVTLLRAGYALETKAINQLPKYNIRFLWINHPGFEFLDEKIDQSIPEARKRLYQHVKDSFNEASSSTASTINIADYREVVGQMLADLVLSKDNAVFAERIMDGDSELFAHCSNVGYLALVIGMALQDYIASQRRYVSGAMALDLTNLGIGAMLHDLGKLELDGEAQKLHHFEKAAAGSTSYPTHTEKGYYALQGRIEPTASTILLHHHQRFDGTGFPKLKSSSRGEAAALAGRRIHIFSRVVAVANAIDGLLGMVQRDRKPTVAAFAALQSPAFEGAFDPVVLRAALQCLPPFGLGTVATLSDGRRAVVIDVNAHAPCRPKVQIMTADGDSEEPNGEQLDLSVAGAPHVAFVGGQPCAKYHYELPPVPEGTAMPSPPAAETETAAAT